MLMQSLLSSIGNTPMVKLKGVLVKLEHLNPSGSVKDRIARYIVDRAEATGQLKKGYTIVEATSGNTGIAFSLVAAVKGYKMIAVMPRGMSKERAAIMRAYGAKVVLVHKDCVKCAVNHAKRLSKRHGYYMPRQFENPWNIEEHKSGMGKEIVREIKDIGCFVAGVGTGGTLIGAGSTIKKKFPNSSIIAVEPAECALLSGSGYARHKIFGIHKGYTCSHHAIEGIGDGFVPRIVEENRELIDGVVAVKSADALKETRRLARMGYFVGPSSGANFLAALKMKKSYKNVVTLFPDRGDRYLSEGIFN